MDYLQVLRFAHTSQKLAHVSRIGPGSRIKWILDINKYNGFFFFKESVSLLASNVIQSYVNWLGAPDLLNLSTSGLCEEVWYFILMEMSILAWHNSVNNNDKIQITQISKLIDKASFQDGNISVENI